MEIIIKQNGKSISIDLFDKQYRSFTGERLSSEQYERWIDILDLIFLAWGDLANYSNKEYSFLLKRMNIQNSRVIPAKGAARCLMVWASLTSSDMDDMLSTLKFAKPVVDFFNSLDNTTFYFTF